MLFWLQHPFVCSKSILIVKSLLLLARLLHEGKNVSLSKFLLTILYESLSNMYGTFFKNDPQMPESQEHVDQSTNDQDVDQTKVIKTKVTLKLL